MLNIDKTSNSQQKLHKSPSPASYGIFIEIIIEKMDNSITASHCIA